MKTRLVLAIIVTMAIIACGKDSFETVPKLKLKSVSPDVVPVNGNLRLNVEYTDKEGDVSDSLFIVRQRLNKKGPVTMAPSPYDIPGFPTKTKGEFEITLEYQRHLIFAMAPIRIPGSNPPKNEIDTLRLKIVAKDSQGNKSDTLVVENVYVIR